MTPTSNQTPAKGQQVHAGAHNPVTPPIPSCDQMMILGTRRHLGLVTLARLGSDFESSCVLGDSISGIWDPQASLVLAVAEQDFT